MKKATIARFVIGLAAISAVGCSAETGAPEAEGVGESTAALHGTAIAVSAANSAYDAAAAVSRRYAASCVIHDGSKDKLVVAGGFNSATNAALNDTWIFDPTAVAPATKWTQLTGANSTLATARGFGKMIPVPGSPNKCIFVAGKTTIGATSDAVADVEVLTVTSGAYSWSGTASIGQLTDPRAKHELAVCGTKVLAISGGFKPSVGDVASIEIWDPSAPTTWASAGSLSAPRGEFAVAKNGSTNQFLVAGGRDSTGPLNSIELIDASSSCTAPTMKTTATTLSAQNEGLVAFFKETTGGADVFTVAGGSPVTRTTDHVSVSSWTTPTVTKATSTNELDAATYRPTLVQVADPTHPDAFLLLGGASSSNLTSASTNTITTSGAQEFQSGFTLTSATLHNSGRVAGVAEYLPTAGKAYMATGVSIASGVATFRSNVEEITP